MNKTARNERRKLSATFLNGVTLALVGAGALGPLGSMLKDGVTLTLIVLVAICVVAAGRQHMLARWLLGGLEE